MLGVAREVIEKLIDDLDGGEAAETVPFALDGTSYEIDLSTKNAAALRKDLGRYISAARHQGASRPTPNRRTSKATGNRAKPKRDFDVAQLRKWAGANAAEVPSWGRIPQPVVEEYKAAGRRLPPAVSEVVGPESDAAVPDAVAGRGPAVEDARRYPHRSRTARPGARSVRVCQLAIRHAGERGRRRRESSDAVRRHAGSVVGNGRALSAHACSARDRKCHRTALADAVDAIDPSVTGRTLRLADVSHLVGRSRSRDVIRSVRRRSDDAGHFSFRSTARRVPPPFLDAYPVRTSVVRAGRSVLRQPNTGCHLPRAAPTYGGSCRVVHRRCTPSGLTNLTDLAFARDASLYEVEIASQGLGIGPIGSLVKIAPGRGSKHETVVGGLFAPYGVAPIKTAAHVTSASTGGGDQLVKIPSIEPAVSMPRSVRSAAGSH